MCVQYESDMAAGVLPGAGRAPLLLSVGRTTCLAPLSASSREMALRCAWAFACVVASSREMAASLALAGLSVVLCSGPSLSPRSVSFANSRRHAPGELPGGSSHGRDCNVLAPPVP